MKFAKFALIPLALVAGSAFADAGANNVAPSTTAAKKTYTVTEGQFVATAFDYNVSANVGLNTAENATAIVVQTASTKGRNNFSGSSEGGSVSPCGAPTTGSTPPTVGTPVIGQPNGCNAAATPKK